jgi:hypothetical protein
MLDARWRFDHFPQSFDCPFWEGEPLHGKAVIIGLEAGHGDMIHFCRYTALLKERGAARIAVVCHPALKRLFATLAGVDQVFALGEALPAGGWHYWTRPMRLPGLFGTDMAGIPAAIPYLSPPSALAQHWRDQLPQQGLRVGLAWKGNPNFENDADRSLPSLMTLAPLAAVPAHFVSLQKGPGEAEALRPPAGMSLQVIAAQEVEQHLRRDVRIVRRHGLQWIVADAAVAAAREQHRHLGHGGHRHRIVAGARQQVEARQAGALDRRAQPVHQARRAGRGVGSTSFHSFSSMPRRAQMARCRPGCPAPPPGARRRRPRGCRATACSGPVSRSPSRPALPAGRPCRPARCPRCSAVRPAARSRPRPRRRRGACPSAWCRHGWPRRPARPGSASCRRSPSPRPAAGRARAAPGPVRYGPRQSRAGFAGSRAMAGIAAGSWPAACSAARIVTPSASSWSSSARSKRPVTALLPRKVLLKRTPSSSAKPITSRWKGRRSPRACRWRTMAIGSRMPRRPSYLPPLRTVS